MKAFQETGLISLGSLFNRQAAPLLGLDISEGTVHNVHQAAARQAGSINRSMDLSPIRVGLHDEIFQGSQPVLA